jgi:hypothetical protein
MNPTEELVRIEFDFVDQDIAKIIAASTTPEGVRVGKPATFIKASAASGGIYVQIAIQFVNDIHDIGLGILVAWLYDRFKQCNKKAAA